MSRTRSSCALAVALALLLCFAAPPVRADELGVLLEAHEANDGLRFTKLASSHRGDPWALADRLLQRGGIAVARRLAAILPPIDRAALLRYLADPPEVSEELLAQVSVLQRLGDARHYREYLAAHKRVREQVPSMWIRALLLDFRRGHALYRTGALREAGAQYEDVGGRARALGWARLERGARHGAARAGFATADFAVVRRALQRLSELARGPVQAALAQADLALLYWQARDLTRAVETMRPCYEAFVEASAEGAAAQTAVNLAMIHAERGEYSVVQDWLDRADVHLKGAKDDAEKRRLMRLRANAWTETGETERASKELEKLLPDAARTERVEIHHELARLYLRAGEPDDALASVQSAEEALDESASARHRADLARLRGDILRTQGKTRAAETALRAALATLGEGDDLTKARTHLALALVLLAAERPDAAKAEAERAQAMFTEVGVRDELADAEHVLARVHVAKKQLGRAGEHLRVALRTLESVLVGLADEPMARLRARRIDFYATGMRIAHAADDMPALVETLERARARALLDALGGRARMRGVRMPPALAQAEVDAVAAVTWARRESRRAATTGKRKAMRAARSNVTAAEARLKDVKRRIEREAKRGAGIRSEAPATLVAIQDELRSDEAVVYLATWDERHHAVVVRKTASRVVALAKQTELLTQIEAFEASIRKDDGKAAQKRLLDLRKALVEPLKLSAQVKRVALCPSARLCFLPWTAIFPRHEVHCIPSATAHRQLRMASREPGVGILALGDPKYGTRTDDGIPLYFRGRLLPRLVASGREVRAIAKGQHDVVLARAEATEQGLRDAVAKRARWRAIHLACHGLIHRKEPTLSALALSPTKADDGFLSVHEILDMDLSADLVVASACDSGRGELVEGEGVLGLTRAFMIAGASQVVVSLWKVDDAATGALMAHFYARLAAGDRTSVALAAAQRHLRGIRDGAWAHPRYWAAWVCWGSE